MEKKTSKNSSIVGCVFVAPVTILPSSCLATIGGYAYRHRMMNGITRVEAGSNTSTVTLRVVRGDEMGLKKAAP
jgi:hypothetical protein